MSVRTLLLHRLLLVINLTLVRTSKTRKVTALPEIFILLWPRFPLLRCVSPFNPYHTHSSDIQGLFISVQRTRKEENGV